MKYEVVTLQDIQDIPEEYFEEFTNDLKHLHKQVYELRRKGIGLLPKSLTFIPDGQGEVKLEIEQEDEHEDD